MKTTDSPTAVRLFVRMIHPTIHVFDDYSIPETIAFILVLIVIVAAPIPYGGVTPLGAMIIQTLAFLAATFAVLGRRRPLGRMRMPLIAIAGIAAIGVLQLIPIGETAVSALSPTTASIYSDTNGILRVFGGAAVADRLSIAPTETVRAALLIAAYLALFITAFSISKTREQRRWIAAALLTASVIHVGYAAISQGDATTDAYADRTHGLFVNPNHFAGYLEIALAVAFAFIWGEILTGRDRVPAKTERSAAVERRMIPLAWRVMVWVVIAVGIAFTKSRMGITATTVALLFMTVLAVVHQRSKKRRTRFAAVAATVVVAAIAVVAFITREVPLIRFLATDPRDPETDSRTRIWSVSVDAWQQFPHFGSGLGTFREAFRRVQPRDLPGLFEQAHNDSLQLLVTGGWIALALAVFAFAATFVFFIRAWSQQRHREESAIALAAMGALLSLLVHGIAEFNFSIPAIPATLAIILGVGWAAATDEKPSRVAPEGR